MTDPKKPPYASQWGHIGQDGTLWFDETNGWIVRRDVDTGAYSAYFPPPIWVQVKSKFWRWLRYETEAACQALRGYWC